MDQDLNLLCQVSYCSNFSVSLRFTSMIFSFFLLVVVDISDNLLYFSQVTGIVALGQEKFKLRPSCAIEWLIFVSG